MTKLVIFRSGAYYGNTGEISYLSTSESGDAAAAEMIPASICQPLEILTAPRSSTRLLHQSEHGKVQRMQIGQKAGREPIQESWLENILFI